MLPLPQCPGQRQEEQTGCCLKAQWLSTCEKHCAVVGWSPDLCGLNQALPCTPLSSKKAYLINPVFYQLCCWWILRIVTSQGTQESSLPRLTHRHCSPCSLWLLQQTLCCCGKSSHHPAFSQSCFSQPFLPSSLGSH